MSEPEKTAQAGASDEAGPKKRSDILVMMAESKPYVGRFIGGANFINPYDLNLSRAVSAADVSQRLVDIDVDEHVVIFSVVAHLIRRARHATRDHFACVLRALLKTPA
mgnify:CR=1 FL=1